MARLGAHKASLHILPSSGSLLNSYAQPANGEGTKKGQHKKGSMLGSTSQIPKGNTNKRTAEENESNHQTSKKNLKNLESPCAKKSYQS